MKRALYAVLTLSIALNILLVAAIANQSIGIPRAQAIKELNRPGTYGPPAMEIIDGDATISVNEVTLQNTLITGNLYLTEQVSQGAVKLQQVEVQGEVIVAGGSFTLDLRDCSLAKLNLLQSMGPVKILAGGASAIPAVQIAGQGTLQEDSLAADAGGFGSVLLAENAEAILFGKFDGVVLGARNAKVKLVKGEIALATIHDAAPGASIELAENAFIENLAVNAIGTVLGAGNIETVDINAPGATALQGAFGEVFCRAEGVFLELQAGRISRLIVPELEQATSIALAEGTAVTELELSARTGVTGEGAIETVSINHAGVTIDQTPGKALIAEGVTAIIAGEEHTGQAKPAPQPKPEPEPSKPSIKINSISKVDLLMVGSSVSRTIASEPTGIAFTVTSSNSGVAAVALAGNKITVTGKGSGKATITVKGTKSGHTSATRTFTVLVKGPQDIKSFRVVDGLSLGKKLVQVVLYADNPSVYKVTVAGVALNYEPGEGYFYGEVLEADAIQSKVKVSK